MTEMEHVDEPTPLHAMGDAAGPDVSAFFHEHRYWRHRTNRQDIVDDDALIQRLVAVGQAMKAASSGHDG